VRAAATGGSCTTCAEASTTYKAAATTLPTISRSPRQSEPPDEVETDTSTEPRVAAMTTTTIRAPGRSRKSSKSRIGTSTGSRLPRMLALVALVRASPASAR
jgi:hypothetical protein